MWLTLEEVAEYLRVSRETVYKLAQKGRLPASKVGNQWRFRKDLLEAALTTPTQSQDDSQPARNNQESADSQNKQLRALEVSQ